MSLTSYRAAPPRGDLCVWAPGSSPGVAFAPDWIRGSRRYEPDVLGLDPRIAGGSTVVVWCSGGRGRIGVAGGPRLWPGLKRDWRRAGSYESLAATYSS